VISNLKNIFKIPDLRNKVLFTLLIIAVYQLGASIPVPGTNVSALNQLQEQAKQGGGVGFLNLFSGFFFAM